MMFQKNAKHRANDASNDVHRPPLPTLFIIGLLPRSLIILHHPQSTALCNKLPPSKPIFSQLASFAPPWWPFPAQIDYLPALVSTTFLANNQLD